MKTPMGFRPDRDDNLPPAPKERWEGDVIDTANVMRVDKSWGPEYDDMIRALINEKGDQGWELVSVGPSGLEPKGHDRLVFKRRK